MIKGLFKKHCLKGDDTHYLYALTCKEGHIYFDNEGIPALSNEVQFINIDCSVQGDMYTVSGKDVALLHYAQRTYAGPVLLSVYSQSAAGISIVERSVIDWLPETDNTLKTHFSFNAW